MVEITSIIKQCRLNKHKTNQTLTKKNINITMEF